MIFGNIGLNVG